ncbi:DUF3307 domain-containing protein [Membranicola marinus]|uniref:DUF3307 domain-containing protein n=1 Tax=Membranihabitans marinus TaxID=1227546 RepID=A0A953L9E5_9BACT|nr:DUF3307 domain-containing protein [Membranihabitans marinus]MBY5957523.1 DUF3307 domain-containing protein [Membranihabitans marinus]
MILPDLNLLVLLFVAHFMGDFTFQPRMWVDGKRRRKWRSPYLYYHALVHMLLATAAIVWSTGKWSWIGVAGAGLIGVGHLVFDVAKINYVKYIEREWSDLGLQRGLVFLWDQIGHFCVLYLVAIWMQNAMWIGGGSLQLTKILIVALGYYFVLYPASTFVDLATRDWQDHMEFDDAGVGLPQAGRAIGQLERLLALTFILLGQYTALGFLIGAKSIFRFGDLTRGLQHKKTEYILIGTLLSFSVVLVVGLILNYYLLM